MAKNVNKVILLGHLGKDPDVRYTPGGTAVAKLSLATNERYKNKLGERQERVEWHSLIAWGRLAEIIGEYTQRGTLIYIEGRLKTSSWDDKQSREKRYRTEVVVSEFSLLSGGREGHDAKGNGAQHANGRSRTVPVDQFEQRWGERQLDELPEAEGLTDDIPF